MWNDSRFGDCAGTLIKKICNNLKGLVFSVNGLKVSLGLIFFLKYEKVNWQNTEVWFIGSYLNISLSKNIVLCLLTIKAV